MAFKNTNLSCIAKKLQGFEDYYITTTGDVYSRKIHKNSAGRIKKLKLRKDKDGYSTVWLYGNGAKLKKVHRLVAETFIPNPDNKPQINHKNGIKSDNFVSNLEWVSAKENLQHSYSVLHRRGVWLGRKGAEHNCSKPVRAIKDGIVVAQYSAASEASRATGICVSSIIKCCNKTRKTAGDVYWEYL